jgi:hypothetical protein
MKYRVLIKSVNVNAASLNWFTGSAGNAPWETDAEQEALQKYQELLNVHPAGSLTLVQVIPVNIAVSA